MIPTNYTDKLAEQLLSFRIPEITKPYGIVTHWFNVHTCSFGGNYITGKMHRHTYFELHLLLNGTAEYGFSENDSLIIPECHGLLIPPGIKHIVKTHSNDAFKFSITFSIFPRYFFAGFIFPSATTICGRIFKRFAPRSATDEHLPPL